MLSTLITEACLRVTIFQTRYRVIRLYTVFGEARPMEACPPVPDNNDKVTDRSRVNLIEPMIKSTIDEKLGHSSSALRVFNASFLFPIFFNQLDWSRFCWKFHVEIVYWRLMFSNLKLIYWDVQCQIFLSDVEDIKNALDLLIIFVDCEYIEREIWIAYVCRYKKGIIRFFLTNI